MLAWINAKAFARAGLVIFQEKKEKSLNSEKFEFEGTQVNYYSNGEGPALLMLHGSGPGASSLGNWRPVLPGLTET